MWISSIIFVRFDAEDSYQTSSRSFSFLESLPIKNGPLTEGMDASALSSYFMYPSAGSCVLCIWIFLHSFFLDILSKFISIHETASSHKLLNDIPYLIAFLKLLPDSHGISSTPGANYISHVQKDTLRDSDDITDVTVSQNIIDLASSWEEVLEQSTSGFHASVPSLVSLSSSEPAPMGTVHRQENMMLDELLAGGSVVKEEFQNSLPIQSNSQVMTISIFYPYYCVIYMYLSSFEKVNFLELFSYAKNCCSIYGIHSLPYGSCI